MARKSVLALSLCLAVLALVQSVGATGYHNGYRHGGYTHHNGYWYNGNTAYTRSYTYFPGYYQYGHYYPGYYSYYYTPYSAPYVPPAPAVTPSLPSPAKALDWRGQLIELAKARDATEGHIRKTEAEQKAYMEALKVLGLEGNFRWPGYGGPPGPPAAVYGQTHTYGGVQFGSFGAQGNSTYGYSVNQLREMYGETSMNTLYQQAARLTQNAQTLAGQATTDFQGLVDKAGDNAGRVAEVLARAKAAELALKAAAGPPSSRTLASSTVFRSDASGATGPPPGGGALTASPPGGAAEFLKTVGLPRCGACHSGAGAKGGYDINAYPSMSPEQKRTTWARILTDDKAKLMPRAAGGGPGGPLSAAEVQAFFKN